MPNNMILLVTGQLNLIGFGNASAALFNGTTFTPFILATSGNNPGSLFQLFTENSVKFTPAGKCHTSHIAQIHKRLTNEKVVIWQLASSYSSPWLVRWAQSSYLSSPESSLNAIDANMRATPKHQQVTLTKQATWVGYRQNTFSDDWVKVDRRPCSELCHSTRT